MTKIHLLIRKEDIDEEKVKEGNKIAVVLDVLLATTTITSALNDGATEVIPVMDRHEALEFAKGYDESQRIVAGEEKAKPIDGFVYPSPKVIGKLIKDKTLILSTTNGTVALRKASQAKKVYVSALINNLTVAERIHEEKLDADTILVVCSGNSGELSLEDFYGAGHFISCLLENDTSYQLTDAAKAALHFYTGSSNDSYDILQSSYVGQLFDKHDGVDELLFASNKGAVPIVPILEGRKVVIENPVKLHSTQ
ncbi:2-phosphosulfolactate phosphatase [Cytobacillus sp. FJAT-54145]|uniref:Probable 2-phosphosulfolactate phosphatase n=1 Tax=Cytobacillus spartinae TaxID=3299023 RepID=A0ABW6K8E1_9BACI